MEIFPKKFIAATREYSTKEAHVNAPFFRKSFIPPRGEAVRVRICGLGFYEMFVNGVNVTKGRLAPYITNPDQSLYYDDYDITDKLSEGKNTIGVWLGNGLQNNPYGDVWDFDKAPFRSAPKLAMAVYSGEKVLFESDESFKVAPSPITFDDLRAGEHYDARQEIDGWNLPSFDDSAWANAFFVNTPAGEATLVKAEPILVHETLAPVSIMRTPKGNYLYDFGLIFTGVCRLRIRGERGQHVRLTYGEIAVDGELNMANITFDDRSHVDYSQCDWYTLKGDGEEIYTPRFTYHGFRYVSVCGITDEQATKDLLTFEVMHSAVASRGGFTCSDETLNVLQDSVRTSDLSNLFYIPTDCPHREKNGWTGDIALSAEQMLMNFSVENTLRDWMFSVRNAQDHRGAIPGIVPTGGWGFDWGAGPNWDDALFEIPYQIYRLSGDESVIAENVEAMEKYLRYMWTRRNENGLFCYGLGDWCQPKSNFQFTTPEEFTDSVKCIDICDKTAKMARVIGNEALQSLAENMSAEIRRTFREKYLDGDRITVGEQTAVACALYYRLAEDCRESLQKQLLELIADADYVFTTGVLGARVMFRVLSEMGEGDLAYRLITQNRYPSYGYHVARGANTLTEFFFELEDGTWLRKDGKKHDSLNHHFWGDISAWMIRHVAGITVNPEFFEPNRVEITPDFLSALTFAEGRFMHANGEIIVRWERAKEGSVALFVTLPRGVFATLRLPDGFTCACDELTEGTQKIIVRKD